ncbi:MAG: carboxypeptidase regulatory-like domain-containing protein [Pirellulales bacterium]|nr:carboxypeptidase regulatory-like domain-containing protein [Pirellulales bacterium]
MILLASSGLGNWADAAWPLVVQLAFDATVVLSTAGLVCLAMRRASAALRHGVWTVAIVGLLALPVLRMALPGVALGQLLPINVSTESPTIAQAGPPTAQLTAVAPSAELPDDGADSPDLGETESFAPDVSGQPEPKTETASIDASPATAAAAGPGCGVPAAGGPGWVERFGELLPWPVVLVGLWAVGVGWGLIAFFGTLVCTQWFLRRARTVDDPRWRTLVDEMSERVGLRRPVAMVESDRTTVPSAAGWFRPRIVLPVGHEAWSDEVRHVVLAHELTHVARRDVFWQTVARGVAVFYWFHPLIWIAGRRLRWEREVACDDAVLRLGERPSSYAHHLLGFAAQLAGRSPLLGAAVSMATRRPIETRIRNVLRPGASRAPLSIKAGCVLVGVTSLVLLLVGAIRAVDVPAKEPSPPGNVESVDADDSPTSPGATAGLSSSADHKTPPAAEPKPNDAKTIPPSTPKTKAAGKPARSLLLTVLDDQDRPVAGARVTRRIWQVAGGRFKFSRHRCDEKGQVRLDVPQKTPAFYTLNIVKPGYAPFYADWENTNVADPIPEAYTVHLDPGQTVGGVVQDAQGNPIVGARVNPGFNIKMRPERTSPLGSGASVRTNAKGQWTYASFPAALHNIEISLRHPDYLAMRVTKPTSQFAVAQGQKPTGLLVMKQGPSIKGEVTDVDGHPIAGVTVRCHDYRFGSDVPKAKTSENGTYRIKNVNLGETFLTASADGWAPAIVEARIERGMNPVDFKLSRGKPMGVRVVDADGQPIDDAQVIFWTWRGNNVMGMLPSGRGKTDAHGKWTWANAPEGPLEFHIYRAGYTYVRDHRLVPGELENVVTMRRADDHVLRVSGRVIDAETKQPIARFRLTPGDRHAGRETIAWNHFGQSEGRDGQYRKDFLSSDSTPSRKTALFRIEADGYLPATSRTLKLDEGNVTLNFALRKDATPDRVVLTPEGRPAARATVAVCTPSLGPSIKNTDVLPNSTCERTVTGTDGRFHLAPRDNQDEVFALMVLHPSGVAYVTQEQFEAAVPIRLEPWARVEGVVRIGGRPAADQMVTLDRPGLPDRDTPRMHYDYHATTDKDGRFAFENVVPGSVRVTRCIVSRQGEMSSWIPADSTLAECPAGQTTHVEVGRQGRPVVGKLRVPDGLKPDAVWHHAMITLAEAGPSEMPGLQIPWPKHIDPQTDEAAAMAWLEAWQKTAQGKDFIKVQRRFAQEIADRRFSCSTKVERDGSFSFDDIPAGDYRLSVTLLAPPSGRVAPPKVIASLSHAFTVPEMPSGKSEKPLDLGELELTPTEHAEIEEPTPVVRPSVERKTKTGTNE